jgi:dTDP-4-dehydrorhamnose reductase
MKVLLFGHRGWIGQRFYEYLNSLMSKINIVCSDIRITPEHYDEIIDQIQRNYVTRVFVVVGTTRNNQHSITTDTDTDTDTNTQTQNNTFNNDMTIDYVENKLDINIQNNMTAQMIMANIGDKLHVHTTIIGTGCIYDDTKHLEKHKISSHKYNETDIPNYNGSQYSLIKATLNNYIVMTNSKNVLHLRIRMPIFNGYDPYDYIAKIIKYRHVIDVPNSMTVLNDFFPIIFDMMSKRYSGTYNIVNPQTISPCEILKLYKQIVDPDYTYDVITTTELHKITIGKRCNVELSTDKIERIYKIKLPDIKSSIVRILTNMVEKNV